MLSRISSSNFSKLLWWLMGVVFLNFSADPVDSLPNSVPEDLTLNEQESFLEILVELVLGFDQVIPEYDDPDEDQQNVKNSLKINLSVPLSIFLFFSNQVAPLTKIGFLEFSPGLLDGMYGSISPPPKV